MFVHTPMQDEAHSTAESCHRDAVNAVCREWHETALRLARAIVPRPDDADGVAQRVVVRLWNRYGYARRRRVTYSLIRRAIQNEAVSLRRRTRRMSALTEEHTMTLAADDPLPDEYTYRREAITRVRAVLATLPSRCRSVLELATMYGLTRSEIAEQLDVSVGAVDKQLARAKRLLRDGAPVRRG
jgi:RNA polymerase sigma factor (sigma-70 family)